MDQTPASKKRIRNSFAEAVRHEAAKVIAQHQKIVLQFGGGKDSLACLYLLRPWWDRITVMWMNMGAALPETVEAMKGIRDMVPHFLEVKADQPAQIAAMGYPADIVPVRNTQWGRSVQPNQDVLLQPYMACCWANMWEPMHRATKDLGATLIIRGQRDDENRRAPIRSGHVEDGVTVYFPIEHWNRDLVFAFLQSEGVKIPDHYEYTESSIDCWSCTAYLDESAGRMRYMRDKHPELWADLEHRLHLVKGAVRGELVHMEAALGEASRRATPMTPKYCSGINLSAPGGRDLYAAAYFLQNRDSDRALRYLDAASQAAHPQAAEGRIYELYRKGDLPRALAEATRAIADGSDHVLLELFAGGLEILMGDSAAGFRRFGDFVRHTQRPPNLRPWGGEPLAGQTIFIPRTFGGFGDEIQWVRFVPELAKRGARVLVECAPELAGVFDSLEGVTIVRDTPEADCYAFMQQIPALLGITRDTIPREPYLRAPTRECALAQDKLRIGISWGCGPVGPQTRYCSLSAFAPLSVIPGAQLYSLEKSAHAAQLYPPPTGMDVIDLGAGFNDFTDTAAAIHAMDLIISTDNVIANLAGALGKPLYALVPSCADYRWGIGQSTPWYPTARVIRQPASGNWQTIVSAVAQVVRGIADAHKGGPIYRGGPIERSAIPEDTGGVLLA